MHAVSQPIPPQPEARPAARALPVPPDEARLLSRRLRGADLESVLAAGAGVRHRMRAQGRRMIASSWKPTASGVTLELVFSEADPG